MSDNLLFMKNNPISSLFNIQYPLIQAGMIWASGWKLASAVSNAGGLGIIGAGSMYPKVLKHHIQACKKATDQPFGVNIPLLYPDIEKIIAIVIEEEVEIVFTSAGNPKTWTAHLQDHGITVAHVVSSVKFALKSEESGVDAIVAEGFEAGGHNSREEITTMTLIPMVREKTTLPLIAAGGIATGRGMLAAMALGADGVQIGTRFVMTPESSSHPNFKQAIKEIPDDGTLSTLKEVIPTRLIKNKFFEDVLEFYARQGSRDELIELIGRSRSKKGMFEGDLEEGELQIGQIGGLIDEIKPAAEIVKEVIREFKEVQQEVSEISF